MTHRVAVVQNESELYRYSYADVRHLLTRDRYSCSFFTSENIEELARSLGSFDALLVTTNSCNNASIRTWFQCHQQVVSEYVGRGGGLLVLFQMALSDYRHAGNPFPFLGSPHEVRGASRFEPVGERAEEGLLCAPQAHHLLLTYPNSIDLEALQRQCLENENAPGLYWGYLSGFRGDLWQVLVADQSTDRPLLIASTPGSGIRAVFSSLVVDWQRHDLLWQNLVRWVVEGGAVVEAVRRRGIKSLAFDELEHGLGREKVPLDTIQVDSLEGYPSKAGVSQYVLDPSWPSADLGQFLISTKAARQARNQAVHFFVTTESGEIAAASIVPEAELTGVVESACVWLRSRWDGTSWDGSFWSTFEVVELFSELGQSISEFQNPILERVRARLQADGSYDDVFGATCAVLRLFSWFGLKDRDYERALTWVTQEAPRQNPYNQATALETLVSIEPSAIEGIRPRIIQQIKSTRGRWTPGLETLRYLRTLVAVGEVATCVPAVADLMPATHGSPEWLTVFGAAETVLILLDIRQNSVSDTPLVDELLFAGMEYLLETRDRQSGSWPGGVVPTAKAAKAIARYARARVGFPGEVVSKIVGHRSDHKSLQASRDLRDRNSLLIAEREDLQRRVQEAAGLKRGLRTGQNWIVGLGLMSYVLLLLCLVVVLSWRLSFAGFVTWMRDWQEYSIVLAVSACLLPLAAVAVLMDAFERDYRWLSWLRRLAWWRSRLSRKPTESEEIREPT